MYMYYHVFSKPCDSEEETQTLHQRQTNQKELTISTLPLQESGKGTEYFKGTKLRCQASVLWAGPAEVTGKVVCSQNKNVSARRG